MEDTSLCEMELKTGTNNPEITINYILDKYFVWNADHIYELRTKYRICGSLVGSLPRKPWQTSAHCVPLILLAEEAYLCVTQGVARVLSGENSFFKHSYRSEDGVKMEKKMEEIEKEQIKLFKMQKKEKEKMFYGMSKKLKRKQLKKLANQCKTDTVGIVSSETHIDTNEDERIKNHGHSELFAGSSKPLFEEGFHEENKSINDIIEASFTVNQSVNISEDEYSHITLSETDLKYYHHSVKVHIANRLMDEQLLETHGMNYPITRKEKTRFQIFKDFWLKGYYITSAEKFGGDYLVYPGDPLRYHSFFIVLVMNKNQTLTSQEMICYGRLAASVKKTVILASIDENFTSVSYIKLDWTHMKS